MISEGESMDVSSRPIAHKLGTDLNSKKQHAAKMRAAHGVSTTYQKGGYLSYHGPVSKVRAATTQHYGDESLAKKNHPHLFNESMNHKSILSVAEAYAQMVSEANTDHTAAANAASEHAKNKPSMATHHAASNAHEKAASALESEIDKIKETDHTGKHDDKVMKMERQAKSHQQQAQRHRFHAHRIASTQKESYELAEKLDPKADAGEWISDFVHSDDPKFAGKSAEERKNQALAAYYSARREAGLKNEDTGEEGDQSNKRPDVDLVPDRDNLAATDAADAEKKQEPQGEIPSWVPGNIPSADKKEFAEAAKKAWESDNTTFDFKGRTYKITENKELVGNQKKLDVNGNGKIEADDLAALRAGKPANEDTDCETETPGQSAEMPEGQPKGDGDNDEDDQNDMGDDDQDQVEESVQIDEATGLPKKTANPHSKDSVRHYSFKAAHATAVAKHLSGIAKKSKKPADHLRAAKAHRKAQDAHEYTAAAHADWLQHSTGERGEESHGWKAIRHEELAARHEDAARGVKEDFENPTDKLTLDVPAMIRSLEKAREDFKSDEDVHNFVQGLLTKKDSTIDTNALPKDTVKEGTPGDAEAGPMVMDPLTQDTKDDHDEATRAEDAPYTNKSDGSDNIVPADKPSPNPTPMNKVTGEQATKSVAEAYVKMTAEAYKPAGKFGPADLPRTTNPNEDPTAPKSFAHHEILAHHAHQQSHIAKLYSKIAHHTNSDEDHANAERAHDNANRAHSLAGRAYEGGHDTPTSSGHYNSELHYAKAEKHEANANRHNKQFRQAQGDNYRGASLDNF